MSADYGTWSVAASKTHSRAQVGKLWLLLSGAYTCCSDMATRRPTSSCLSCQVRQALVGRRRTSRARNRKFQTNALTSGGNASLLTNGRASSGRSKAGSGIDLLASAVDAQIREAYHSLEALWKGRDERVRILRKLSNPWPEQRQTRMHSDEQPSSKPDLPVPDERPISHDEFRVNLALAQTQGDKVIRSVLRAQLLRCETPKAILRVVAVAMQTRTSQVHFAALHEPVMRALYRCRGNVRDTAVLSLINTLHDRFALADLPFSPQLLALGLKFAARTRSVSAMRKYLRAFRQSNLSMTSNVFRSVIAKCSIGHRGLGEIRNGRWRRSDLLQVCLGFDDTSHLPPTEQYHFSTFLVREDWQYLHGWIAVLARCKHSDAVWDEWQIWKHSPGRLRPMVLAVRERDMTTRTRGDYWFVEQMTYSGDFARAWQILLETGMPFGFLNHRIQTIMLEGLERAPPGLREANADAIRKALLHKYDKDLGKIEAALGVRWIGDGGGETGRPGHHELVADREEILDRLGSDDWKLEEDYGFPLEDGVVVSLRESEVHDALEVGPA